MRAPASVTGDAASLLEIDPWLGAVLGPLEAAARGNHPVAPVLAVARGPWSPPPRERLGPGAFALVVLDGLLLDDAQARTLAGPLDRVEPWDPAIGWTACTNVRVAVIGESFVEAVRAWPEVVERLLARAGGHVPPRAASGAPEERLLALLWHLAARWGQREMGGIALPFALETGVFGRLTELPVADVTTALAALRRRSAAVRRDGGGWLLPAAGPHTAGGLSARRDALRARAVEQFAVARAAQADCNALCHDLDLAFRLTVQRRRPGP